jgi:hypothetical protein
VKLLTIDSTPAEHAAAAKEAIAESLANPPAGWTATPEQQQSVAAYAASLFGVE